MFCPKGPTANLNSGNPTATLPLSGINRDNPVIRVQSNGFGQMDVNFTGPSFSADFNIFGTNQELLRVPAEATSVTLTLTGGSGTAQASAAIGENA